VTVGTSVSPATEGLFREMQRRCGDIRQAVLAWAPTAARRYPWRQPGRSAYEVLVAELLLKRTTATAAARVYEGFLVRFPSLESLAAAHQDDLEAALASVGLHRQRARALRELAAFVLQRWGGDMPKDMDQLLSVPHLGPYAAGAIRSFAFGRPAAIVDSNVERIMRRAFQDSMPNSTNLALVREVAERLLPVEKHREFNLGLLDLGALVCRYVRPRCGDCPLLGSCDFGQAAVVRARTTEEPSRSRAEGASA